MEHFHVVRWGSVRLMGEKVPVADVDYAALATAGEAQQIQERLSLVGDRCAMYLCFDHNCTLHEPRVVTKAC